MLIQIICGIFILSTFIQLLFWLFLFSKLAFYKEEKIKQNTSQAQNFEPPVSIVICAKNELENLRRNLPRILNQNYRSYEVIVVNDNSTDDSLNYLTYLQQTNSQLQIVNIFNKKYPGKKAALVRGIEEAQHDVLLLTDADCCPASANWLNLMQATLKDPIKIGLGYAPYIKIPGFLNRFIRFETVYTAIQYLSFALARMPYMGVGRNLIYHKSLFYQVNGFQKHEHIASGDDDLFVNEVATGRNTGIVLQTETFLFSPPKSTWKTFIRQKSRHLTTGKHYKLKYKLLLGLLSATHIAHYVTGIIIALKINTILFTLLYLVRISVITPLYGAILKKLQDRSLLKWVPLLDAVLVIYYLLFAPIALFGNTNRWN